MPLNPQMGMRNPESFDPFDGFRLKKMRGLKKSWEEMGKILGAHETREYDELHGRWWNEHKEKERPKLFSTIGRHARDPKLFNLLCRWVMNTPGWRNKMRDTYRKRWPKYRNLSVQFFAEFGTKPFKKRTLLETASTVPLDGAGYKFFRGKSEDSLDTKGQYFIADSITYKHRPIHGYIVGTQHLMGRPVRGGVAPMAKTLGSWCTEPPAGAHLAVHRPPFPGLIGGGEVAEADAE